MEKEAEETARAFEDIQNIQSSMTQENTRLATRLVFYYQNEKLQCSRNSELEERLAHVDEELTKINEKWKRQLEEQKNKYEAQVGFIFIPFLKKENFW